MEEKINYPEIFRTAWRGLLSQFWLLVGLYIGFTIIYSLLMTFITPEKGEFIGVGGIIVSILALLLFCLFQMGYLKNCLQTLDGEEPQFSAYGQVSRQLFRFLIANLLFSLIVIIGLAFFIIPGIYLGLRLQFFYALIVDENTGIIESFKRSWKLTNGYILQLFVLLLIMVLIYFAGTVALFIGIFIAAPLVLLMYGYTYRKLTAPAIE